MRTCAGSGYGVDTFIFICNACDVGLGFGPLRAEVWTGGSQQRRDAGGCRLDTRVERLPQRDDTTDVCARRADRRAGTNDGWRGRDAVLEAGGGGGRPRAAGAAHPKRRTVARGNGPARARDREDTEKDPARERVRLPP